MSMLQPNNAEPAARDIVIGANSKLWKAAAKDTRVAARIHIALSHRDISGFTFGSGDRVWVFSYSRVPEENTALLSTLERAGVAQVVYLASSSTIVLKITSCYEYPRVKKLAEDHVRALHNGRILMIGLVAGAQGDLPGGINAFTSQSMLNDFLAEPKWNEGEREKHLFRMVERPFRGRIEEALFNLYTLTQKGLGSRPCLLRPVDLVLRAAGFRWYGYLAMSNRLWSMTTL